jgi:hypothetical protein
MQVNGSSGAELQAELSRLAANAGIQACALVDRASGLVLMQVGAWQEPGLWEAAAEYWRLHSRVQGHFERLGGVRAMVMHHLQGMLVLLPCGDDAELLLACVGNVEGVDWRQWQVEARSLTQRTDRAPGSG